MSKIPTLRLVRHAYFDLVGAWRSLVQAGGLWLILPWVLHTAGGPLLVLLGDVALLVGIAAVAVAWHRRLLLGEPPPARYAPINAHVGRYLGFWVLLVALSTAPSFVLAAALLGGAAAEGQEPGAGPVLAIAALALACLLAAMRLQLVFPAAATGDRAVTLRTSWEATRGNGWRLLAGVLMVSVPPAVAGALLAVALSGLAEATGSLVLGWLARLAPIAGAWLQAPLLSAFLSFAYLHLRAGGDPGAAVPARREPDEAAPAQE